MHEERLTLACLKQSQGEAVFDSETELHKAECELQQQDVNLQSAVARLAAIRSAVQGRDLRHLRLQDLQVGLAGITTASLVAVQQNFFFYLHLRNVALGRK